MGHGRRDDEQLQYLGSVGGMDGVGGAGGNGDPSFFEDIFGGDFVPYDDDVYGDGRGGGAIDIGNFLSVLDQPSGAGNVGFGGGLDDGSGGISPSAAGLTSMEP